MQNTIAERVADFLKRFAPFDRISNEELLSIAQDVTIRYLPKRTVLFEAGSELQDHFFIIYRGAVSLKNIAADGTIEIADQFDEGDVFGLRPLFAKEQYFFTGITSEETILYAIPIEKFRPIAEHNRKVGKYLMESFASRTENPYTKELEERFFKHSTVDLNQTDALFEMQPVMYVENIVTAKPEESIQSIANKMKAADTGSVILVNDEIPVGIITNKRLRNLVATGLHDIQEPASAIMVSPILCYPKNTTIAQAQTTMMKHNVSYIAITEDGTPNTKLIGLVSEEDILAMKGNNPSVLMRAIQRAMNTKELKRIRVKVLKLLEGYIMQNLPLLHTSRIIFELNDATIKRLIQLSLAKMEKTPPVKFAWMSLGSQGRKEQLLQTDQDNAIVFENVSERLLDKTRQYFLELAKAVNDGLKAVGFAFCPAEMMARNPKYCLSLNEWKQQFDQWTSETGNEELLLSSIFFDFDISYGDVSLTNALSDYVFELTSKRKLFMAKLAASAVRSASPLGFFRQFLLEKDGKYKDHFDLKARALMPFIDAGRVFALSHQIKNTNNTIQRFERMAQLEPQREELFLSCSYAFKALLKFRTKHGLLNNDTGRYIQLEKLTKEERMKLKRSFKTLSSIQDLITVLYGVKTML